MNGYKVGYKKPPKEHQFKPNHQTAARPTGGKRKEDSLDVASWIDKPLKGFLNSAFLAEISPQSFIGCFQASLHDFIAERAKLSAGCNETLSKPLDSGYHTGHSSRCLHEQPHWR